jgi:hypothetical protein
MIEIEIFELINGREVVGWSGPVDESALVRAQELKLTHNGDFYIRDRDGCYWEMNDDTFRDWIKAGEF